MACINVTYGAVVLRETPGYPQRKGDVIYPPAMWGDYLEARGVIRWRTYEEFKAGIPAPGEYADRMMTPARKRGRPRKARS